MNENTPNTEPQDSRDSSLERLDEIRKKLETCRAEWRSGTYKWTGDADDDIEFLLSLIPRTPPSKPPVLAETGGWVSVEKLRAVLKSIESSEMTTRICTYEYRSQVFRDCGAMARNALAALPPPPPVELQGEEE